jgi:hypothetical protein
MPTPTALIPGESMKLLILLALTAAAYHYAGPPGLVLLGVTALVLLLARLRPFRTCPRCRGLGKMRRVVGPAKYCRTCKGTGLRSRRARRKALRLPAPPPGRLGR